MNLSEEKVTALSWRVFRQDVARPGAGDDAVATDGAVLRWRFLGVNAETKSPHVPASGLYQQSGFLLLEVPTYQVGAPSAVDGTEAVPLRAPCLAYLKVI